MDPLVKAHLRIAALEQELQDPERIKVQMGGSFSSHYLRVIPMPGDIIRCAEMDEPMPVVDVSFYSEKDYSELSDTNSYVVSEARVGSLRHICRLSTCMDTIKIQRRGRGDFEQSLLRAEFGRDNDD